MSIKDMFSKDIVTVSKETAISEAARLMKEKNVGTVIVVDNAANKTSPIGMLTDRDIAVKAVSEKRDPESTSVEELMEKDLLLLSEDEDIDDVLHKLTDKEVRRAPVVDADRKLIGLLSLDDILETLSRQMGLVGSLIAKQTAATQCKPHIKC